MPYRFYIDGMELPVTPSKLQVKTKSNNKTVNLINEGDINILKMPGLKEISFEFMLPQSSYPFVSSEFTNAKEYLDKLKSLKENLQPFQFQVKRELPSGRATFDDTYTVSLEDYTVTEDAKDGLDLTVSVKLKEYKAYSTKAVTVTIDRGRAIAQTGQARSTENAPNIGNYTVKKGDCLWNIAKYCLGDGSRYKEIYADNQAVIDAANKGKTVSKYTIYTGQILSIPNAGKMNNYYKKNKTSVSTQTANMLNATVQHGVTLINRTVKTL